MSIRLQIQTEKFIYQLGKRANMLQIVAAETVNDAAADVEGDYKRRLQRSQRIKTKFTLGSVQILRATPTRKSGEPRLLKKINAIIGVRKMKGGVDHYLADLEEGSTNRGNPQTKGKVPVPLNTARTGKSEDRPISGPNRLTKGDTQTLRVGGRELGTRRDGLTASQRFGVLYGQKKSGYSRMVGDPRKPFYFIGKDQLLGIYKLVGSIFRKIRNLDATVTRTKKQPHFKRAVKNMTPDKIKRKFNRKAEEALRDIR